VLLDKDQSVKLSDFADSGLVPLDMNMEKAKDNGTSIRTGIFQFASLVFEILTGRPYKYDLLEIEPQGKLKEATNWEPGATWPQLGNLPATEHLALGQIIRKCWTKKYQTMKEVCHAVERELEPPLREERQRGPGGKSDRSRLTFLQAEHW
jgi:hypothetical protein